MAECGPHISTVAPGAVGIDEINPENHFGTRGDVNENCPRRLICLNA